MMRIKSKSNLCKLSEGIVLAFDRSEGPVAFLRENGFGNVHRFKSVDGIQVMA